MSSLPYVQPAPHPAGPAPASQLPVLCGSFTGLGSTDGRAYGGARPARLATASWRQPGQTGSQPGQTWRAASRPQGQAAPCPGRPAAPPRGSVRRSWLHPALDIGQRQARSITSRGWCALAGWPGDCWCRHSAAGWRIALHFRGPVAPNSGGPSLGCNDLVGRNVGRRVRLLGRPSRLALLVLMPCPAVLSWRERHVQAEQSLQLTRLPHQQTWRQARGTLLRRRLRNPLGSSCSIHQQGQAN